MSDLTIAQLLPYAPLEVGNKTVQTINAERVHAFLEVKTRYDLWIRREVKKYAFQEDRDFTAFKFGGQQIQTLTESISSNYDIEYHVTLDMAKALCMVARQPKGEEARAYFIQAEEQLQQAQHDKLLAHRLPLLTLDKRGVHAAPVCWNCDALVTPFDLTLACCQHYKVCFGCWQSAYDAATPEELDAGTWDYALQTDRARPWPGGQWKTVRDVPALREASTPLRHQLEQQLEEYHQQEDARIMASPKLRRLHGIRLLRPARTA